MMISRSWALCGGVALVTLLFAACSMPSGQRGLAVPGTDHLIVAHYFDWYQTPEVRGSWHNWEWKGSGPHHDPANVLTNGRCDICSVYYPLIGPYDSSRPEVMEYHILTALAAKIDGFVIDWYGIPSDENKLVGPLLDMAARCGFKIAICFEDKTMFAYHYNVKTREEAIQNAVTNLNYILETYAGHEAYLKVDGRPVVVDFSWCEPMDSVREHAHGFFASEWRQILAQVRPKHELYFIHDVHCHIREQYWDAGDNVYPWLDVNGDCLDRFWQEALRRRADGRIGWITSLVYPGFDNTGVWGWGSGPYITPREDGAFYSRSWERSLTNNVRLVQIATWNDFGEGATIEPTLDYGFKYLEMTERLGSRFKGVASDEGRAVQIPLLVYRARVAIESVRASAPETAAELGHRMDAAVDSFLHGRLDEAAKVAVSVADSCKKAGGR